ncbi:MAG: metal-dependent hydrolase [Chitinophagales bacterium]|nr:metal-dependent hydrolase [Chitinophagales bacterium]MCZ2393705.1 metal-dependent hydrolase [Chitinophagales bacterium]
MNAFKSNIKVRNVKFEFSDVPKHWILNNPFATHFVNSMHVVFPEGEKFFVRSVKRFEKEVKDQQLKSDIKGFCGQEGIHAREHQRFWDVMNEQGLNPEKFARFLNTYMFKKKYSVEGLIVNSLNQIAPRLGDKMALSITTGLEHYTAIIAKAVFEEPILSNKNIAPQLLELLHWHACEEIEHKAVCFDVLKEIDDDYILRVTGMLIASLLLFGNLGIGTAYFLWNDKDLNRDKLKGQASEFKNSILLNKIGRGFTENLKKYFDRNFHPNDIDETEIVRRFFSDKSYA